MVHIFLLCVDCSGMQGCTAARLLRCASFSAVAAQCALWVRSGKCSVLLNRDEHFASFAAHNTLAPTQRSAQRQRKAAHHVPAFSQLVPLQHNTIDHKKRRPLHHKTGGAAQCRPCINSCNILITRTAREKRGNLQVCTNLICKHYTFPLHQHIAQQQRKENQRKTSLPQCIFAHFSNRRTTKNTHRTALFPSTAQAQARSAAHHVSSLYQPAPLHFPRTSAERGQEKSQSDYRAPNRTMV